LLVAGYLSLDWSRLGRLGQTIAVASGSLLIVAAECVVVFGLAGGDPPRRWTVTAGIIGAMLAAVGLFLSVCYRIVLLLLDQRDANRDANK
jgi:hypothetical protein